MGTLFGGVLLFFSGNVGSMPICIGCGLVLASFACPFVRPHLYDREVEREITLHKAAVDSGEKDHAEHDPQDPLLGRQAAGMGSEADVAFAAAAVDSDSGGGGGEKESESFFQCL